MIDGIIHVHQDICYDREKWRVWADKVDSFTPDHNPEFGRDLGGMHWQRISEIASSFVKDVGGNERDVILADIAGLLCGCGLVNGFDSYADHSARMAYKYLTERYYGDVMNGRDIDIVCHAIANHVSGEEIQNVIDAALCFADKIDIGVQTIKQPVTEVQKAQMSLGGASYYVSPKADGMVSINYEGGSNFAPYGFLKLWPEGYIVPHKAANFIGRPFALFLNENTLLWKPDNPPVYEE